MKLKVVCLNVWIGGILFDEILEFLKQQDADVVLLQEVFDGKDKQLARQYRTVDELQKVLKYPYLHFAPTFIENVEGQEILQGNLILSTLPLQEQSTIFYDRPFGKRVNERDQFTLTPRNLQHVTADVNGTQLHFLNTQGIWGEDGRDTVRRLQMCEKIVDEVKGRKPLLLAGDLNVEDDTESIALIEEALTNVFKDELETSFNTERKDLDKFPGYGHSVVDMMFVSEGVQVLSHECPKVDVSDHLPLVAEVKI